QTGDQVGLVTFNGTATTKSPLTNDFPYVEGLLAGLTTDYDTDTGGGIKTAQADFPMNNTGSNVLNVMVLLTDGLPTVGTPDPTTYTITNANVAKQAGTRLITIGLGKAGEFNPDLLKLIASAPDDYHYASNSSVV